MPIQFACRTKLECAVEQPILGERDRRNLGHVAIVDAAKARLARPRLSQHARTRNLRPRPGVVLEVERRMQERVFEVGIEDLLLDGRLGGMVREPAEHGMDPGGKDDPSNTGVNCRFDHLPSDIGLIRQEGGRDVENAVDADKRLIQARAVRETPERYLGRAVTAHLVYLFRSLNETSNARTTFRQLWKDQASKLARRTNR
jgi:hypothetical protein